MLQQGVFDLISDFWQFRPSNSAELSLVLRIFKLHQENWHGRGVRFNKPVQAQKVESTQSDC